MQPWFIWDNQNSYAKGLWINKLPKITRAKERYQEIVVPGREGSLIMLEGDDVYDSYVKECTVITRNDNALLQEILAWLRGSGEVVFSNEINMAYDARIAAEVSFERISNDLCQAKIPFFVKPYKKRRNQESITISTSGTIYNPGDVASKPVVSITANNGTTTVTIAGQTMTFTDIGTSQTAATIVVDCDARIIKKGSSIWTGTFTGEFWKIPKGSNSVTGSCVIQPNWRWV